MLNFFDIRKSLLFFFIAITSLSPVTGQSQNLILTSNQNNKWLDSLSELPLYDQLSMIKERLLSDTCTYVQIYSDRLTKTNIVENSVINNKIYSSGKPILIIDGFLITINNNTSSHKIILLTQLLNTYYIDSINILKGITPKTTALYGAEGRSGVIIMSLKRKKYLKYFKQLKLL